MIRKIVAVCLCLVFVGHFLVTIVYNTPSNPVHAKYKKEISMYMDPVFTQNWRLFAPRPVSTNHYYYVKAKLRDGQNVRTTDWIDLTDYMYEQNHKNRITPLNRILRIPRGAHTLTGEQDESIIRIIQKVNSGELKKEDYEHLIENEGKEATAELATSIINRFAEAQLVGSFPDEEIVEFKVLLVEEQPVPFSKKDDKNYKKEQSSMEFDWTKPENVVTWF